MRIFILILISILALFQYDLWFGDNGYLDYKNVQAKISESQAENEKLSQRNQRLRAEVEGLTKDFKSIEERARMQYSLVKDNEVFYRLSKENR